MMRLRELAAELRLKKIQLNLRLGTVAKLSSLLSVCGMILTSCGLEKTTGGDALSQGQTAFETREIFQLKKESPLDYMLSQISNESQNLGYSSEASMLFWVHPASGRNPVYRCNTGRPSGHFFSHQENCEGFSNEGLLGYLDGPGVQNLRAELARYRCVHKATGAHKLDIAVGCSNGGWEIEGGVFGWLAQAQPRPEPTPVPASPYSTVYQFHKAEPLDFMLSADPNEGPANGFALAAQVTFWAHPATGRKLVYRCNTGRPSGHFFSHQENCEGFSNEGLLGYLDGPEVQNLRAELARYRCVHKSTGAHKLDIAVGCSNGGWEIEGGVFGWLAR